MHSWYWNCLRENEELEIVFCVRCSVNHFVGVLEGSEKWMILISIRDPNHWKYVRRARLWWSPDYCSGLHTFRRNQSQPASDSLDQSQPVAEERPMRGCEMWDRKQILTDRVSHNEAKSSPVYTQKTAENTNIILHNWWLFKNRKGEFLKMKEKAQMSLLDLPCVSFFLVSLQCPRVRCG